MGLNIDGIQKNFNAFLEAKKQQALYLKLFFISSILVNLLTFCFAYKLVSDRDGKVIVVNGSGQQLASSVMDQENMYETQLQSACYSLSYYANTFDVNNIKMNQARAAFYLNRADLNAVIEKYQFDKAYSDVLNKGVVYRCSFDRIESLKTVGNEIEYDVVFTSTLSVITNTSTLFFRIISRGTAIRTTYNFPDNPTGFYFKSYIQEYYPIEK